VFLAIETEITCVTDALKTEEISPSAGKAVGLLATLPASWSCALPPTSLAAFLLSPFCHVFWSLNAFVLITLAIVRCESAIIC